MKLCLPRKAKSLVKSQLSTARAKQIAECGRGAWLHSCTGSLGRGLVPGTKILQGTEEADCWGGTGALSLL